MYVGLNPTDECVYVPTHARKDACTRISTRAHKLIQARKNDFTPLIKHVYMTDTWLCVHLLNTTHTHTGCRLSWQV